MIGKCRLNCRKKIKQENKEKNTFKKGMMIKSYFSSQNVYELINIQEDKEREIES